MNRPLEWRPARIEKKCKTANEDAWKAKGRLHQKNIPVSQNISFVIVQLNYSDQSQYHNHLPSLTSFTDLAVISSCPSINHIADIALDYCLRHFHDGQAYQSPQEKSGSSAGTRAYQGRAIAD